MIYMALKPSILNNNYVKFVRTNNTLWHSLMNKDSDTLYFIVDPGEKNGSLYLGDALIATSIDEGLSIEELTDVALSITLANDDVLIHENGKWVNKPINSFMPVQMIGAKAEEDGEGGLVPAPEKGQQNLYLRGDGSWASPTTALETTVGTLLDSVAEIETNLITIIGSDANASMREVAEEVVANIVDNAPEAFDTLKEIADWITGEHTGGVDAVDLITDVSSLKETVFTSTTGLVDRVGTLEESLAGLQGDVGGLYTTVDELSGTVEGNTSAIGANAT
jgi:hypothetical protein